MVEQHFPDERVDDTDTDRYFRGIADEISGSWSGPHKRAVQVALAIMAERIIKEIGA